MRTFNDEDFKEALKLIGNKRELNAFILELNKEYILQMRMSTPGRISKKAIYQVVVEKFGYSGHFNSFDKWIKDKEKNIDSSQKTQDTANAHVKPPEPEPSETKPAPPAPVAPAPQTEQPAPTPGETAQKPPEQMSIKERMQAAAQNKPAPIASAQEAETPPRKPVKKRRGLTPEQAQKQIEEMRKRREEAEAKKFRYNPVPDVDELLYGKKTEDK